jgi:hypothetical protein
MGFKVVHLENWDLANGCEKKLLKQEPARRAQEAFDAAIEYLKQSELATFILQGFDEREDITVIVVVNDSAVPHPAERTTDFNQWAPQLKAGTQEEGSEDYGDSIIQWWSGKKKKAGDASAALGLMHEIGHEVQFRTEYEQWKKVVKPTYKKKYGAAGGVQIDGFKMKGKAKKKFIANIEDTNVVALERAVANQINAALDTDDKTRLEPIRKAYLDERMIEDNQPGPKELKKPFWKFW